MAFADHPDAGQQIILLGSAAFDLDDQHRLGIQRIAGMGERLAGVNCRTVHEFKCNRNNTGRYDPIHARTGDFVGPERRQHRAGAFRAAQDAHGHFGDHRQLPLAAGQQPEPVIPGSVEMRAADLDDLALDRDDLQPQQIVGGDAVFQAMGAARVHVHVAADHAGKLAGGVGRVEEAALRHRLGDADIGHPGLHDGEPVVVIDLYDTIHPHQPEHHSIGQRQRSTG